MFNSWQKFNSWQCVPNVLFILGELIQSTRLAGIWAVLTRMALYRFFVLTLRSMRSWWTIVPPTSTMCQCWSWICRTLFQTLKTADSAMTVCQLSGFDPVLWHLGFFRSLRRFGIVSEKMRNIWPTLIGLLQPRKPILVESGSQVFSMVFQMWLQNHFCHQSNMSNWIGSNVLWCVFGWVFCCSSERFACKTLKQQGLDLILFKKSFGSKCSTVFNRNEMVISVDLWVTWKTPRIWAP